MADERAFKPIEELTLMDDYMFAAVMRDTKHLKPLLEYILEIKIAKIELVEPQKTAKEGYSSKESGLICTWRTRRARSTTLRYRRRTNGICRGGCAITSR